MEESRSARTKKKFLKNAIMTLPAARKEERKKKTKETKRKKRK